MIGQGEIGRNGCPGPGKVFGPPPEQFYVLGEGCARKRRKEIFQGRKIKVGGKTDKRAILPIPEKTGSLETDGQKGCEGIEPGHDRFLSSPVGEEGRFSDHCKK
jgi:hypothetical protein